MAFAPRATLSALCAMRHALCADRPSAGYMPSKILGMNKVIFSQ